MRALAHFQRLVWTECALPPKALSVAKGTLGCRVQRQAGRLTPTLTLRLPGGANPLTFG